MSHFKFIFGALHSGEAVFARMVDGFVSKRGELKDLLITQMNELEKGFTVWILGITNGLPMAKERPSEVKEMAMKVEQSSQKITRVLAELRMMLLNKGVGKPPKGIKAVFSDSGSRERKAWSDTMQAIGKLEAAIQPINDLSRDFAFGLLYFDSPRHHADDSGESEGNEHADAEDLDEHMINPYAVNHDEAQQAVYLFQAIASYAKCQLNGEKNPVIH